MSVRKEGEGDEMLVVHKAAKAPAPAKSEAAARRVPALDQIEFEVSRKRFMAARNAQEKQALLAEVQRKFGNEKAAELVKARRAKREETNDEPPAAKPKPAPKGKQ